MDDKVKQWLAHVSHFRYFSLLPKAQSNETLATKVIKYYKKSLFNYQIVISGPFDMAYATRDALVRVGVQRTRLYSDAFDFENNRSE